MKKDTIVTLVMINGAEIIGKFVSEEFQTVKIYKPRMVQVTQQGVDFVNGISMTGIEVTGEFEFAKSSIAYMVETVEELKWVDTTNQWYCTANERTSKMRDPDLLYDYVQFVDEVTSDASKNPDDFSDALDIIDEQGVPPERLLTVTLGICAEGGEFTEVVKNCLSR